MSQEKIKYHEIKALGFNEEPTNDTVYFNEHGFEYVITTKDLTNEVYIDWAKETQLCKLVRVDKKGNVKNEMPIKSLDCLKRLIDFFDNEKVNHFTDYA